MNRVCRPVFRRAPAVRQGCISVMEKDARAPAVTMPLRDSRSTSLPEFRDCDRVFASVSFVQLGKCERAASQGRQGPPALLSDALLAASARARYFGAALAAQRVSVFQKTGGNQ